MNLLISPIAKDGTRKVGLKVTGFGHKVVTIFKSFDFSNDSTKNPFSNFLHFCCEFRAALNGTEYSEIELTDGWDVQDVNYYIDYSASPIRVLEEDKDGLPVIISAAAGMKITYKKTDGSVVEYKIDKLSSEDNDSIRVIVEDKGFRHFKKDRILSREGF